MADLPYADVQYALYSIPESPEVKESPCIKTCGDHADYAITVGAIMTGMLILLLLGKGAISKDVALVAFVIMLVLALTAMACVPQRASIKAAESPESSLTTSPEDSPPESRL